MLTRNEVEIEQPKRDENGKIERDEMITRSQVDRYIKQSPTKKFLGIPFSAWIYNFSNPDKTNWWNNFLRRLGREPVILDTALTRQSSSNIKIYMDSRGYFESSDSFDIRTSGRHAHVTYSLVPREASRIGSIDYDFRDPFLKAVILSDSAATLLHSGDIFDTGVLNKERVRIASFLKDNGYFNFSVDNISFVARSVAQQDRVVDLTVVVKQYVAGFGADDKPIMENNPIYRIKDVYVYPDYNPAVAAIDSLYYRSDITSDYNGLYIVSKGKPGIRPEVLRNTINLYPGSLYDAREVKRVYDNLMRMGYYKSASIIFNEVPQTKKNVVTFVGDSDLNDDVTTTESLLNCKILCTPTAKQGYSLLLEATTTSSFYGISTTLGYQNRNLFRGAELFDISFTGGYEFLKNPGAKNSFELGGQTSLSLPRFMIPKPFKRRNMAYNPQTRFELAVNYQRRPYYHRSLSSATFGYNWSNGKYRSFAVRPIDVSLVDVSYIDHENFLDKLQNPYLAKSYESKLIAGVSGSYLYNNPNRNSRGNYLVLRLNCESNGNLLYGLSNLFSRSKPADGHYKILGIQYSEYIRADVSLSNKISLSDDGVSALVYRGYAGCAFSYGNSQVIPFDRLFYAGGSNSMRGWVVRTLGPGNVPYQRVDYPSQLGNMRLEANLEFRFPIWGAVHGATFFDAGNIWYLRESDYNAQALFRPSTFLSQLGFNTGLGIRIDVKFVLLRLDWGIRIHDPNQPSGERWIHNFKYGNTALNFGIGYPF